jgi:hypothetical protein
MDENRKRVCDEIVSRDLPGLIRILENCFDFGRRGFRQAHISYSETYAPNVVYESGHCRVRFVWQIADPRDAGPTIYIEYGRLHAPVDKSTMVWKGHDCHCWHKITPLLTFLEGIPPQTAAAKPGFEWLPVMIQFQESQLGRSLAQANRQPEWISRIHAAAWDHYGQAFFDLLDLRQPDLWEKYTSFMVKYYMIHGHPKWAAPPLDRVC